MNRGFRIQIEEGLPAEQENKACDFAHHWMGEIMSAQCSWVAKWSRGGWRSYLRRGTFGYSLNGRGAKTSEDLVFRRISKRQRIFGIMRAKHMRNLDGTEVNYNQCMCPMHLGGTRVTIPEMPEMRTYAEIGEIKG